jgi:hypothetical protein
LTTLALCKQQNAIKTRHTLLHERSCGGVIWPSSGRLLVVRVTLGKVPLAWTSGRVHAIRAALKQACHRALGKFPTDQGTQGIDTTQVRISIQRCTPAIVQAGHHLTTPLIRFYIARWHSCVGQQQNLQATATGPATAAGNGRSRGTAAGHILHLY